MVPQQLGSQGPSQSGALTLTLSYPDRFYAAALFAGFTPTSPLSSEASSTNFSDETKLALYALYQQATVGPCNIAKPWSWNVVEYAKWTSWNQLGKMAFTEAMRLFVRTLEEEDPDWMRKAQEEKIQPGDQSAEWWSKAHDEEISSNNEVPTVATGQESDLEQRSESSAEQPTSLTDAGQSSATDVQENITEDAEIASTEIDTGPASTIELPSAAVLASSNGTHSHNGYDKIVDQEVELNEPDTVNLQNNWFSPPVSGRRPAPRYQHAAAVVGKKMFVIGGNHNGRYLSDVQELDLETFTWSKVEHKSGSGASPKPTPAPFTPCAGHSLIRWGSKLLMVAGHSKQSSDWVTVRAFDVSSSSWSTLPSYGQAPVARGGQTVTKMGSTLLMFGGEDSKRRLHNDLHILDLETMTWDTVQTKGTPPSPRSDHAAALHDNRSLLIFGGGSHSTCFNDLHVLDLETMAWSQPAQEGFIPSPRAGHAAVTIGNNWYIMGGGDNKSGISDTLVLNLSTFVWQIITTEQGRTPIASEGLSVVAAFADGAASLISFGGYNGRYSNEVHVLRTSSSEKAKLKVFHSPAAAAAAASAAAAFAVSRSQSQAAALASREKGNPIAEDTKETPIQPVVENLEDLDEQEANKETTATELMVTQESSNADTVVDSNAEPTPDEDVVPAAAELQIELEAAKFEASRAKQELASTIQENSDLEKELVTVRGQLAAEQSRCFRLEVDVLELRQKLQTMDALQKELDIARRHTAAAEEAAINAAQKPNAGVWGWLAGHPQQNKKSWET